MNTESAKGKANRNTDGTERGPFAVQTWNALDEASNKQWRDVATYKTMGEAHNHATYILNHSHSLAVCVLGRGQGIGHSPRVIMYRTIADAQHQATPYNERYADIQAQEHADNL